MTIFPPKIQQQIETANKLKTIRAAIYARISSLNQKFNYSIDGQIASCQEYIDQRRWVTKYVFCDECETGKNNDRPMFQKMLEKAKSGCFDVLVFWKLDRICRSLINLLNLEKSLREYGVSLCSTTEFVDTMSSIGRFNFRTLGSVGEFESELISERCRLGLAGLARNHLWPNNNVPLGYKRAADGKLKIYSKEAKIVKKIFRLYLREKSMAQVAFKLNCARVLTRKGLKWTAVTIGEILRAKIYTGLYSVGNQNDFVAVYRIIDDLTFSEVTELRLRYRKKNSVRPQIPMNRKKAQVDKIFGNYFQILKGESNGSQVSKQPQVQ